MRIKKKRTIVMFFVIFFLIIFCYWQNNAIVVTNYVYASSKINESLNGYRIVQISDLHNKRFGKNQEKLIEKLKECKPNLIVITGDLVDSNRLDMEPAIEFVRGAVQLAPTYFITGNHEIWLSENDLDCLLNMLEAEGVTVLRDEKELLRVGEQEIELIGLDDESNQGNALHKLDTEKSNQLKILLAHEPQYFENYCRSDVDIIFTGHAHGGQIIIPVVGGLVAPDQGFFPKYTEGVFEKNNTRMIISRGLGNSIVPLRIFNFPEIVCVDLEQD